MRGGLNPQSAVSIPFGSGALITLDGGLTWAPSIGSTHLIYENAPTFQSTLLDIMSGLRLGLIDPPGIANSLVQKIQAAENSTGPDRINILIAFIHAVDAQAGKHITGLEAFKLRADAAYLDFIGP